MTLWAVMGQRLSSITQKVNTVFYLRISCLLASHVTCFAHGSLFWLRWYVALAGLDLTPRDLPVFAS